ncbi:hypothetical protein ACH3VR_01725 [Microbacterium sp. B2969]|uniref:Membrane lipoprotein n=1 Tax=Microbacterium alkaliflavum TaxID=3248839 RepID=A0ABW7Q2L9_9MICO
MRLSAPLRPALAVAFAAAVALTLTACATGAGAGAPADSGRIAESARSLGIAPELVYTTEVDGYDLAVQSVGPNGSDGLQGTWFDNSTGGMLTIRTDRGELTAATCPATPLEEAYDAAVTCEQVEDGLWHRSAGDAHEYVATRGGVLIRVSGSGAPPEDLQAAAQAAHVPSAAELELLFSDAPEVPTGPPVERGDIPQNGDGAPIDQPGPGG